MNRVRRWRWWLASMIAGGHSGWSGYAPRSRFRMVAFAADTPWWKRQWYRLRPPTAPVAPPQPIRHAPIYQYLSEPWDEVGVAVPVQSVLTSADEAVVVLSSCLAFTSGFQLAVGIRRRHEPAPVTFPQMHPEHPELSMQIGVRFADGRATPGPDGPAAIQSYLQAFNAGEDPPLPLGPLIGRGGGGGGGRTWNWQFWVWPLPPDGPMTVTCHWPAGGVPDGSAELDGSAIRRAGESSRRLWTD